MQTRSLNICFVSYDKENPCEYTIYDPKIVCPKYFVPIFLQIAFVLKIALVLKKD